MKRFLLSLIAAVLLAMPAVAKEDAPMTVDGATTISTEEAKALFDEGVAFIDTREDAAWDLGRIPGAVHLDVKTDAFNKDALTAEVAMDEKVVFYCNGNKCGRSASACTKAVEMGYTNVYYYRGGFPEWKAAGYPVE